MKKTNLKRSRALKLLGLVLLGTGLFIVHSCKKERSSLLNSSSPLLADTTISQAKEWYDAAYPALSATDNKAVQSTKGSSKDWSKMLSPYWAKAVSYKSKDMDMVETPALKTGDMAFTTRPGDPASFNFAHSNSLTTLLVIKKDGAYGVYAMTILADDSYLKGDYTKLAKNTYRSRQKDFTGLVLYHKMDGTFVNGWHYVNGKVTTPMYQKNTTTTSGNTAVQSVVKVNLVSCESYDIWQNWVSCSYSNNDPEHSNPYDCDFYQTYVGVYTSCYDSGSGPGGGPPTNPSTPPDPCPTTNALTKTQVNQVAPPDPGDGGDGPIVIPTNQCALPITDPCAVAKSLQKNPTWLGLMGQVQATTALTYETGWTYKINDDGTIDAHETFGAAGASAVGPVFTQAGDGFIHSHNAGDIPTFSANDIKSFFEITSDAQFTRNALTFTGGVVTAAGTSYLIKIDDLDKFQNFGAANLTSTTFANFSSRYDLNVTLKLVNNDPTTAYELALLNILKDAGVIIYKGNGNLDTFKPMSLTGTNNNQIALKDCK